MDILETMQYMSPADEEETVKPKENELFDGESTDNRKQDKQHKQSYECKICGKLFSFKTNLYRHTTSVHKEKYYTCDVCGRAFTSPGYLKRHSYSHIGGKDNPNRNKHYKCVICKKVYKFRSGLEKHSLRCQKNNRSKKKCIRAELEVTVHVIIEDNKAEIVDDQSQHILSTLENGEELVYVKMEASDSE